MLKGPQLLPFLSSNEKLDNDKRVLQEAFAQQLAAEADIAAAQEKVSQLLKQREQMRRR